MSAPSLITEVSGALSPGYPQVRFNNRERQLLSSVKTYVDGQQPSPTTITSVADTNILVYNSSDAAWENVSLSGDLTMTHSGVVTLASTVRAQTAVITVSQADLTALHGTPKQLIAAPGAGKVIIVSDIEVLHSYSTAAYTGGGQLQIQYHGSTDIMDLAAAVVTSSTSHTYYARPNAYDVDNSTGSTPVTIDGFSGLAVDLTCASANFGAGNAANILKVVVRYYVKTLAT